MSKSHITFDPMAFTIWATMRYRISHLIQQNR